MSPPVLHQYYYPAYPAPTSDSSTSICSETMDSSSIPSSTMEPSQTTVTPTETTQDFPSDTMSQPTTTKPLPTERTTTSPTKKASLSSTSATESSTQETISAGTNFVKPTFNAPEGVTLASSTTIIFTQTSTITTNEPGQKTPFAKPPLNTNIIGAIIGASVAICILIAVLIFFVWRRRKRQPQRVDRVDNDENSSMEEINIQRSVETELTRDTSSTSNHDVISLPTETSESAPAGILSQPAQSIARSEHYAPSIFTTATLPSYPVTPHGIPPPEYSWRRSLEAIELPNNN